MSDGTPANSAAISTLLYHSHTTAPSHQNTLMSTHNKQLSAVYTTTELHACVYLILTTANLNRYSQLLQHLTTNKCYIQQ